MSVSGGWSVCRRTSSLVWVPACICMSVRVLTRVSHIIASGPTRRNVWSCIGKRTSRRTYPPGHFYRYLSQKIPQNNFRERFSRSFFHIKSLEHFCTQFFSRPIPLDISIPWKIPQTILRTFPSDIFIQTIPQMPVERSSPWAAFLKTRFLYFYSQFYETVLAVDAHQSQKCSIFSRWDAGGEKLPLSKLLREWQAWIWPVGTKSRQSESRRNELDCSISTNENGFRFDGISFWRSVSEEDGWYPSRLNDRTACQMWCTM